MNRAARIGILSLSVVIFCYAGIGHVLGRTPDDRAYKSLSVYGEVLQRIQSDYVDEPNMRLVTAGSLHGLLESLDPQSSYLTPREYTEFKQKQQSSGTGETGLTLSKRFGYVIVISVLPESSADKAGIHSGDIFESIAGFTTRDKNRCQVMARITALIYNWWTIYMRLGIPDKHAEAITSRPLALHGIARRTRHSNQTTVEVTSTHSKALVIAEALTKVSGAMSAIPTKDLREAQALNAFYFTPALKADQVSLSTVFSTHPSLDRRLRQLSEISAQLGR